MKYPRVDPRKHQESIQLLRDRFWDVFNDAPNSLAAYAKFIGIPTDTLRKFLMENVRVRPQTFVTIENWVIKKENE